MSRRVSKGERGVYAHDQPAASLVCHFSHDLPTFQHFLSPVPVVNGLIGTGKETSVKWDTKPAAYICIPVWTSLTPVGNRCITPCVCVKEPSRSRGVILTAGGLSVHKGTVFCRNIRRHIQR